MRRVAFAVAMLLLARSMTSQSITESIEVHILELEAVVLDRAGNPVTGLTGVDFEVNVDGKPAEVMNFFVVNRGEIVESRDAQPAASEAAPASQIPARLFVVIDDLHLRQAGRKRALDALKGYVESGMTAATTVAILRWNGMLKTRVKPTSDRAALLRGIAAMQSEPSMMLRSDSERRRVMRQMDDALLLPSRVVDAQISAAVDNAARYVEERARETENTLGALAELIAIMSGLDGRKTVLYVSEAMPQQPGAEVLAYGRQIFGSDGVFDVKSTKFFGDRPLDAFRHDQSRGFMALASLAQSAGVVFSALDPSGVRGNQGTNAEFITGLGRLDAAFIRENESSGARMIAAETGGRYISNENDLDHAIAILTDDVNTYYSLGVRPPNRRTVNVSVRVRGRSDLRVLTSRRRTIKSAQEAIASGIRARLYSREESNPLDVRLVLGPAWPRGERCVAPVRLTVPAAKLAPLPDQEIAVHAMVLDDRGIESTVRSSTHAVQQGAPATIALDFGLKPRRYVVSLAVVEKASGETSYLLAHLDATICGH